MERVSLREVEEGLTRARVSAHDTARTASDRHAIDLATVEHERLVAPLRAKLTTLHRHSATARSGLQDTTRTLREQEARVASLTA